jgi:steroid 5-alpha reductase family enzyme
MWGTVAIGAAAVSGMMAVLWLVGRQRRNMAIVDVGWTVGLGGLGILYAARAPVLDARRLIIAAMAGVWSLRLALHLLGDRVLGHDEEGRYRELRARWAPRADLAFFVFFQAQAALDVLLSLPCFLAARNGARSLSPLELGAPALLAVAVTGETIADRQLARWKADPQNRGKTCRRGLWRYSRHPNYFFEWLVWWAFALLALPAPHGWLALACPLFMLLMLFRVTGIPATEAQALRSRGDDYRRYQRETSAFIPWFPRQVP